MWTSISGLGSLSSDNRGGRPWGGPRLLRLLWGHSANSPSWQGTDLIHDKLCYKLITLLSLDFIEYLWFNCIFKVKFVKCLNLVSNHPEPVLRVRVERQWQGQRHRRVSAGPALPVRLLRRTWLDDDQASCKIVLHVGMFCKCLCISLNLA